LGTKLLFVAGGGITKFWNRLAVCAVNKPRFATARCPMRAKMLQKVAEPGIYMCQRCSWRFPFEIGSLACPRCANRNPYDLVPIYMEPDRLEEEFMTDDDYGQGD